MYGVYEKSFRISKKGINILFEKIDENIWKYERGDVEKFLNMSKGRIVINPVEPVNLPKKVSSYLLLDLEKTIVLAPKEKTTVYLKFPIEIGVLGEQSGEYRILDIFSFVQNKYTLYGSVSDGIVCKYWKTPVYYDLPKKVDPLKEGIVEFRIQNSTGVWVDVNEIVISAFDMKIYYDKNMVGMKGRVKILGEDTAEVKMFDSALRGNMSKSVEIFVAKKMLIPIQSGFIMEEGV